MTKAKAPRLTTRDFAEADAPQVHALLQALAQARGRFESNLLLRKSFVDHFPAYVNAVTQGDKGIVRVAEVEGQVCGVCIAQELQRDPWLPTERTAELKAIYVDPAQRGCGAAKALADDVAKWAREQKLAVVSVHTFADHPEEAEALQAMGFKPYRLQLERRVT